MDVRPTGSGWGFKQSKEIHPIFTNLYDKDYSQDFNLHNLIQKLRFQLLPSPIFDNSKATMHTKNLPPIIIFPDLGESDIIAKWNKTNSKMTPNINLTKKDFEDHGKWNCREIQPNWVSIWFPTGSENDTLDKFCWEDNIGITYDQESKILKDHKGVISTLNNFGRPPLYMNKILDTLEALGYSQNKNLHGACYDFRKIACDQEMERYTLSVKKLIEESTNMNGMKAIILGHGLGSCIANYFLNIMEKSWKDTHIDSFVSYSGSFGGCPKALRTILSGMNMFQDYEKEIITRTIRNFTGLQWLLPSPYVYESTLLTFKNISYGAKEIPELLSQVSQEASDIYTKLVFPKQCISLNAPKVKTYVFGGRGVYTENFYSYKNTLLDDPLLVNATGDGTVCDCSLEFPLRWTSQQEELVYYKYYENLEHLDILNREEPVKDLIGIIKNVG